MRFTSNPFLPNSLEPKKRSKKEGGTVSWEISPCFSSGTDDTGGGISYRNFRGNDGKFLVPTRLGRKTLAGRLVG